MSYCLRFPERSIMVRDMETAKAKDAEWRVIVESFDRETDRLKRSVEVEQKRKIDNHFDRWAQSQTAIVLYNGYIFYTNQIGNCFWCKDPCCRIDIGFESYLCRDCEPAVMEDLQRLGSKGVA